MQLTSQTQWMKAQKHADVMAPNGHFDVIQTADEASIFFSLGTDNVLWATKEVQQSNVGWTREDLSSRVSASINGASVKAKAFAVSQNAVSGKWDLVLAVTAGDSDHLFISQGNDYSVAPATGMLWTELPFDSVGQTPAKVQIADVFIMNSPSTGSICVVDIWRTPGTNNSLDRYFITPDKAPHWNKHLLAIDLDAGSVNSVLGQRTIDRVAGIYTYGSIEGQQRLIYAPLYNAFRPDSPPKPARLVIPQGSLSVASAVDLAGHSCLFIAHLTGLSVFPPTAQGDGATAVPCVTSTLVAGASQLQAMTVGSTTSVWGRNAQGQLFYVTCPAGSEAKSASWSTPIILLPQIEQFAFYNGISTNSHTLFAHIDGQKIIELDQDPVTTCWRQRNIMLPSTDVNDWVEFDSYTTRLEVVDDNLVPQPNIEVGLTSVSPVPVFVNDVYYLLNTRNPVLVKTDSSGSVSMVQQTDSLAAVCYNISVVGAVVLVDPTLAVMQKLQNIQDGASLAAVRVADSSGATKPLISSSIGNDDKQAAAQAIKQFCDIAKTLKPDGSPSGSHISVASKKMTGTSGTSLFSLAVNRSAAKGQRLVTTSTLASAASVGETLSNAVTTAGDFLMMLYHKAVHGLQTLEVRIVDGIHYIFAKIEGVVYHAVLDSIAAITHAIQWVLQEIKILWDDMVAWLGFIFGWKDIVRTHLVMKNLIKQYIRKSFDAIETAEVKISTMFEGLEQKLNALTDVTDPGITVGSITASRDPKDGFSSPQSHWGINHVKTNISNATMQNSTDNNSVLGSLETVLHDLEAFATNEVDYFQTMVTQMRTQVIEPYHSLTPLQIVKRLVGIVSDLLLKSAKNFIVKLLDIIKALAETVLNVLDAPINIPVLGPLYKKIADADLSILDLVVLVLAIPATVVYKIAAASAPFPDNATTTVLINATSFQSLKDTVNPVSNGTTIAPMLMNRAVVRNQVAVAAASAEISPADYKSTYQVFSIIGRFFGAFTAIFGQMVQDVTYSYASTGDDAPGPLKVMDVVNSVLSQIPAMISTFDHTGTWEVITANVVTDVNILKLLLGLHPLLAEDDTWKDKVNPALTVVLELMKLPAPIGTFVELHNPDTTKSSDSTMFSGLMFARVVGCLNPMSMVLVKGDGARKTASLVLILAADAGALVQAVLMTTSGVLICRGK